MSYLTVFFGIAIGFGLAYMVSDERSNEDLKILLLGSAVALFCHWLLAVVLLKRAHDNGFSMETIQKQVIDWVTDWADFLELMEQCNG